MSAGVVQDFMSKQVVVAKTSETLETLVGHMRANAVSGLPVMDPYGRLVGVVSDVDLARVLSLGRGTSSLAGFLEALLHASANETLEPLQTLLHRFRHLRVASCMSSPAIAIGPEESLERAAQLMRAHKINRLPVVQDGKLLGILTRTDVLRALATQAAPTPNPVHRLAAPEVHA